MGQPIRQPNGPRLARNQQSRRAIWSRQTDRATGQGNSRFGWACQQDGIGSAVWNDPTQYFADHFAQKLGMAYMTARGIRAATFQKRSNPTSPPASVS